MFRNMKLSTKLLTSFSLVAAITLIVGFVGWNGARTLRGHLREVGDVRLPSVQGLLMIEKGFESVVAAQRSLLNPKLSEQQRQNQYDAVDKARDYYGKGWAIYEPLPQTDEESQLWNEFVPAVDKWRIENDKFFAASRKLDENGIHDPTKLRQNLERFTGDHYKAILAAEDLILNNEHLEGGDDHTACAFGKWIAHHEVNNPRIERLIADVSSPHRDFHDHIGEIKQLVRRNRKAEAQHLLHAELEAAADNVFEIFDDMTEEAAAAEELMGEMQAQAMGPCIERQRETIHLLEQIVGINLDVSEKAKASAAQQAGLVAVLNVTGMLVGTALALALGIFLSISISRALKRIIDGLQNGSGQVASASEQLASSSQQMSEGASEQASSLEEVSSSLEEMASMTKQNADNARQARTTSGDATNAAQQGKDAMAKMSETVNRIKASSDETAKIIKTIDEIAMQTNLLALNAAVEAARAGEAGRGFAVVAEEVRNLAQRSAEAAKSTSELIEGAQRNADSGVEASGEVATLLEGIIDSVQKVNQLIGEVSAASDEQSQGIDQVNNAVAQMDTVTQSNAANAEESASASEELSGQAQNLNAMVAELVAIVGGAGDTGTIGSARRGENHARMIPQMRKPTGGGVHSRLTATGNGGASGSGSGQANVAPNSGKTLQPSEAIPFDDDEELKEF